MTMLALDARAFGCPVEAPPECAREVRRLALAGVTEMVPFLVGLFPFALAVGVAIGSAPGDRLAGWLGGPLLFNGATHLLALSAVSSGASWYTATLLVVAANSRLALYSAALSQQLGPQPRWFRWAAPYFLVEPVYALVGQHLERGVSREQIRAYYLTAGVAMAVTWTGAIGLGVLAGPVVPTGEASGMVLPVVMVGSVVPILTGSSTVVSAVVAGVAMLLVPAPGASRLIVAAVLGMLAGVASERLRR
jgi:predicted branched-subunit amino acid permease